MTAQPLPHAPHPRHPVWMQALRSALFNLIMIGSVLIYAPLALLSFPFPPLARYRFISLWGRFHTWLVGALCGLRYRIEGREHLPRGTAIILAKHQSTWETFAFQEIFPPQVWVLKHELLWVPLFGWALRLLDPIAIDRGSGRKAVQQIIDQGRQRLESGRWVVIFPEGTRQLPDTLHIEIVERGFETPQVLWLGRRHDVDTARDLLRALDDASERADGGALLENVATGYRHAEPSLRRPYRAVAD